MASSAKVSRPRRSRPFRITDPTPRHQMQETSRKIHAALSGKAGCPSAASISEKGKWSGRGDSNARHQPWQGCALPLSYARKPLRKPSRWRMAIIYYFALSASRFLNFFRFSKATPEFEQQEPKRAKRFSPSCPLPVLRVLLFKIPQDPSLRLPPALFLSP